MRREKLKWLTVAFLAVANVIASAQSRPFREARSENGQFVLKLDRARGDTRTKSSAASEDAPNATRAEETGQTEPDQASQQADNPAESATDGAPSDRRSRQARGECRAMLSEIGPNRRSTTIWRKTLVNESSPEQAFVRDDGRFVVTLDEYRRGGAAHAVVVYDERGSVRREFALRELLDADDWRRVRVRRNYIEWLRDARMGFSESHGRELFEIALRWGTKIEIDLESGELVGGPRGVAEDQLPDDVRAALGGTSAGKDDNDELAEAENSEDGNFLDEAARLLSLITGMSFDAENLGAGEKNMAPNIPLELLYLGVLHDGQPLEVQMARGAVQGEAEARQAIENGFFQSEEFKKNIEDQVAEVLRKQRDREASAGNSFDTGTPVPQPDPAHPVDYIDWMKSQVEVEGPSAVAAYQAAIDSFVEFKGDEELFSKALDGDPDAIASEPVQAWLAANQNAMLNFGNATQQNYRGMPIKTSGSEDPLYGILLPHLSPMRQISRAMVMQGRSFENEGDFASADRIYLQTLTAGSQTSQGPTLIENLVGVAQQGLASNALLDSFAKDVDMARDYTKLAADLEQDYRPVRPTAATMQGERAMLLDVVQRSYTFDPDSGSYDVSPSGMSTLGELVSMSGSNDTAAQRLMMSAQLATTGFQGMRQSVNEHYDRITTAAAAPFQEGKKQFAAIEAEISSPDFRLKNPLISTMLPSISRAAELNARAESNRRATMTVANIMAYRQQHGDFPESLDALGKGSATTDPLTGQPFVYRRDASGNFTLYSLGANGTDEGAVHDPKGRDNDYLYWPRPANKK